MSSTSFTTPPPIEVLKDGRREDPFALSVYESVWSSDRVFLFDPKAHEWHLSEDTKYSAEERQRSVCGTYYMALYWTKDTADLLESTLARRDRPTRCTSCLPDNPRELGPPPLAAVVRQVLAEIHAKLLVDHLPE